MHSLADILERFNRKERNLLLRDALGHRAVRLRLSEDFRRRVAEELGIAGEIPEDAWWATDYHIEWLAGALAFHAEGKGALDAIWPNPGPKGCRLVEGNQEDVDLLIAWDEEIVLVEAKAYGNLDKYGTFKNAQVTSKLARLDLLQRYHTHLPRAAERQPVRIHFLLASPERPQRLTATWPDWARKKADVSWIPLELGVTAPVLAVTRCDMDGRSSAKGNCWRILEGQGYAHAPPTLAADSIGTKPSPSLPDLSQRPPLNEWGKAKLIAEIERLLGPSGDSPGILGRHGRVMMSSWDTVTGPQRYYVLGINPGGEEVQPPPSGESILASLHERREGWNYWLDDAEPRQGKHYERTMDGLEAGREVPVSNALFLRSADVRSLPEDARVTYAQHCAPIHRLLLKVIQPRVLVCFGIESWSLMTGRGDPGHWNFHPEVPLEKVDTDYRCGVLLLPHPAQGGPAAWSANEAALQQAVQDARAHAGRA